MKTRDFINQLRNLGYEIEDEDIIKNNNEISHFMVMKEMYDSFFVVGTIYTREASFVADIKNGFICLEKEDRNKFVDLLVEFNKTKVADREN